MAIFFVHIKRINAENVLIGVIEVKVQGKMQNQSAEDLLQFQARKDIVYLYKNFLTLIEDIRDEHFFMLEKLEKELPVEYHKIIRASNYMDDNKFALLRKRTLDAGNNAVRQVQEGLAQFDIKLK